MASSNVRLLTSELLPADPTCLEYEYETARARGCTLLITIPFRVRLSSRSYEFQRGNVSDRSVVVAHSTLWGYKRPKRQREGADTLVHWPDKVAKQPRSYRLDNTQTYVAGRSCPVESRCIWPLSA